MINMIWYGDKCDKYESRRGIAPFVISNHITAGRASSVFNWFTSPTNKQASSQFVVCRDGTIHQYVRIEHAAWTQGISIPEALPFAKAPVVGHMKCNPNLYCVSIEHEGYIDNDTKESFGIDGTLTEAQFYASCWLHRYIKDELKRIYGMEISLGNYNVIGHFQIDPRRKPNCPGPNFPWSRMYAELAVADQMTLQDYEGRIKYLQSDKYKVNCCLSVMNEIDWLKELAEVDDGDGAWAKLTFMTIYRIFDAQGVLADKYSHSGDFEQFHNDALYIYQCAIGKVRPDDVGWGIERLNKVYPFMLQSGLATTA